MIKILAFVILIFSSLFLVGQNTLNGNYCFFSKGENEKKVEVECIQFKQNNRFESNYNFYEYKYGFGKYFFEGDSLILQYDSCPPKITNKFQVIDSTSTKNDSVIIEIKFIYGLSERFQITRLEVALNESESYEKDDLIADVFFVSDSIVILKFKKRDKEVFLDIHAIGTSPSTFQLDGSINYKAICYLYDSYYGRIDGEICKYKIVKKHARKLIIQSIDFEGNKKDIKYKRKK